MLYMDSHLFILIQVFFVLITLDYGTVKSSKKNTIDNDLDKD